MDYRCFDIKFVYREEYEMAELRLDREAVFCEHPEFPKNMLLELTNICNHKCVFCGYRKMRRPYNKCDKEFSFDIMQQAYDNGTREIGFYMIGEPLMCADIEDYIKKAKEIGFSYIYLTTNGALANIERMRGLLESGLNSVKFSVNAATKETYALVHGKNDYETVVKNICDLSYYIEEKKLDIPVFLSFVKNKYNENEVRLLKQQFEKYVDKIYIYSCINLGGGILDLFEDVGHGKDFLMPGSEMPCSMLFNRLHITCEGYLNACCADADNYLAVENLHDMSLQEAWNSERMVELRKEHLSGHLSENNMCYQCIYNVKKEVRPINPELFV